MLGRNERKSDSCENIEVGRVDHERALEWKCCGRSGAELVLRTGSLSSFHFWPVRVVSSVDVGGWSVRHNSCFIDNALQSSHQLWIVCSALLDFRSLSSLLHESLHRLHCPRPVKSLGIAIRR
ncbi:hypothetical protein BLNAU_20287 [Blattamonas nauphoetae]|uniref:Uncharacterized protein n=1 Tax=Blattamonas nauphoetae TaxID=2049346 RepID=A0ABQ9X0E8_9EUKA|nr:hypothetical protein BLNAU_20287 [Blattamonas nauphoetae]